MASVADYETIRGVLAEEGHLDVSVDALDDEADLYDAGLKSLPVVAVFLALEEAFGITIPEPMLRLDTFRTVRSIGEAVTKIREDHA